MKDNKTNSPKDQGKKKDPKLQGGLDDTRQDPKQKLTESENKKGEGLDREQGEENFLDGYGPLLDLPPLTLSGSKEGGGKKGGKEGTKEGEKGTGEKGAGDKGAEEQSDVKEGGDLQVDDGGEGGGAEVKAEGGGGGETPKLFEGTQPVVTQPKLDMTPANTDAQVASTETITSVAQTLGDGATDFGKHVEGVQSDLAKTGVKQKAALSTATINQAHAIQVAANHAVSAVEAAILNEETAARSLVSLAKGNAARDVDARCQPHLDPLVAQLTRVQQTRTSVLDSINRSFDTLEARIQADADAALAEIHKKGKGKQQELQAAATGENDYEKRKNKARGDAAVIVASKAEERVVEATKRRLADVPAARKSHIDAAVKFLDKQEARINGELERVRTAAAAAKASAGVALDAMLEAYLVETAAMKANARATITREGEELAAELHAASAAYQKGIDATLAEGQEMLADAAAFADKIFGDMGRRFSEWSEVETRPDEGAVVAYQAAVEKAHAKAKDDFTSHAKRVQDAVVNETTAAIDQLTEQAGGAAAVFKSTGDRIAKGLPGLTTKLTDEVTKASGEATAPLAEHLPQCATELADIDAALGRIEAAPAAIDQSTVQSADKFQGLLNSLVGEKLDTAIATYSKKAAGGVLKRVAARAWSSVATAVVAVVATAVTVAGMATLGLPVLGTLLATGAAVMGIGLIKQQVQAWFKGEKLTWAQRGKEAILSLATGVLASFGATTILGPPMKGVVANIDLAPFFAFLKSLLSTASETFVGKVAVRATLGMLPRKIDELRMWLLSKMPSKKKKKTPMLMAGDEELSAEAEIEREIQASVEKDNKDAIDSVPGTKIPGSGTVATLGHTIKAGFGG